MAPTREIAEPIFPAPAVTRIIGLRIGDLFLYHSAVEAGSLEARQISSDAIMVDLRPFLRHMDLQFTVFISLGGATR